MDAGTGSVAAPPSLHAARSPETQSGLDFRRVVMVHRRGANRKSADGPKVRLTLQKILDLCLTTSGIEEAAQRLDVGLSTLKRTCRGLGMNRDWRAYRRDLHQLVSDHSSQSRAAGASSPNPPLSARKLSASTEAPVAGSEPDLNDVANASYDIERSATDVPMPDVDANKKSSAHAAGGGAAHAAVPPPLRLRPSPIHSSALPQPLEQSLAPQDAPIVERLQAATMRPVQKPTATVCGGQRVEDSESKQKHDMERCRGPDVASPSVNASRTAGNDSAETMRSIAEAASSAAPPTLRPPLPQTQEQLLVSQDTPIIVGVEALKAAGMGPIQKPIVLTGQRVEKPEQEQGGAEAERVGVLGLIARCERAERAV
eukprot:3581229-Rhodomonas_salina.1